MTEQALEITNLQKTYSNGVQALHGINFNVAAGDFYALLGPNGAGKSTTIGIISSLVNKSRGEVKIFGHDLDKERNLAKSCIGLVPQEFNFNIFEKIEDVLINQAGYYGVPYKIAKRRAEIYLKKLNLWEKRKSIGLRLSGGMKRRLMIARALIHEPKLLILDEPTAGVDIELRRSMWEFLTEMNKKGTTIILTTHYLEEAENLCRNIGIIDRGELIKNTSKHELLRELNVESFLFYTREKIDTLPNISSSKIIKIDEYTIEAEIPKESSLNNLMQDFRQHNIEIISMKNKTNRLEELFLRLTKAEKEEDNNE